ncbi:MAG: hypothetical protein AB1Y25_11145, partial [Cycloclasticus sp.]
MMADIKINPLLDQDAAMASYLDGLLSTLDAPQEESHDSPGMKLVHCKDGTLAKTERAEAERAEAERAEAERAEAERAEAERAEAERAEAERAEAERA